MGTELLDRLEKLGDDLKPLCTKQAAEFLGLSEDTLRTHRDRPLVGVGAIPYVRLGNGRIRYVVKDLKEFLRKRHEVLGR